MFVGGIVLVVQVLIDYDLAVTELQTKMTEHTRRTEELMDRRFEQVSEATALYGRVQATALREDQMTRLVSSAASIKPDDHLLRRFADYEIDRLAQLWPGNAAPSSAESRSGACSCSRMPSLRTTSGSKPWSGRTRRSARRPGSSDNRDSISFYSPICSTSSCSTAG